jgi:uncharacterized protein
VRIGFDIDGVLADFNTSFIALVKEVTGRDLFPPDYWPHTWDYPQALGYSQEEVSAVWDRIKAGGTFWNQLAPLPDMEVLAKWMRMPGEPPTQGYHEFYFITSRMGRNVKLQTEEWLDGQFEFAGHTVLISSEKGAIAKALKLNYYVDDRAENILDVMKESPTTISFLVDQPWNRHVNIALRIRSIAEFLDRIDMHTRIAAKLAELQPAA